MTRQEIINAIAANKGGMFTVQIERPAQVKKAFEGQGLTVKSCMQLQKAGYGKMKAVREAVEAGEREAPQLPKWVNPQSIEEKNGLRFIEHWNGTEYLSQPIFAGNKPTKVFLLNGKEMALDAIQHMLLSKEFVVRPTREDLADKGQVPFATIKLENISEAH